MSANLTIIIPAYNEQDSLKAFLPNAIAHCKQKNYLLIVVNDGSTDQTKQVLHTVEHEPEVKVLHHKLNKGYGAAIKTGVKNANTDYVITIDADGQHSLEDVDRLLEATLDADADMAVGNRKGQNSGWYRNLGKGLIRGIARLLMPLTISDLNSGMKLYNTKMGKKYLSLCPDNMAYSDVIALVFISQRHLVIEQPITVKARLAGTSTISTMTAVETVRAIVNIVMLFNPGRIFIPTALILIITGLTWGIPILLKGRGLSTFALFLMVSGLLFVFLGLIAEQLSQIRKSRL